MNEHINQMNAIGGQINKVIKNMIALIIGFSFSPIKSNIMMDNK